ncbi:Uncharacterised protein [Bordetella pertussis]|nr:Uncharacterised protein [Bordetella pertussis]CPL27108.1 Uncharacterised protein [Bordetella pertussis]
MEQRGRAERPGGDAPHAEEDVLDDEVAVQGMHDGPAHQHIVERRLALVEHHQPHGAEHLPALGGVLHAGQGAQALDVDAVDVVAVDQVHVGLLEGHRARGRIGNDLEADAVQVGQAGFPVFVVAHQRDVRAAHPFLELERAGAHRVLVGGVVAVIGALVEMLGHHGHGAGLEHRDEGSEGFLQADFYGGRVYRAHAFHIGVEDQLGAWMHLAHQLVDGKHHVVGAKRLAVVPFHVGLQLEGIDQAVGRDAPGARQAGLRLEVRVVGQQALEDLAADELGGRLRIDGGDQDGRLGMHDGAQRAAAGLGLRGRAGQGGDGGAGQQEGAQRAPDVSVVHGWCSPVWIAAAAASGRSTARNQAAVSSKAATLTCASDTASRKLCTVPG